MRHTLIFLILFILSPGFQFTGFSQQKPPAGHCKIKGRVVDSATGRPVEYATVAVFLTGSATVAGGMITDEKGLFIIENLPNGSYDAKIDFIGYNTRTIAGIPLSDDHPSASLGDVTISSNAENLNQVTITSNKRFMENHIDRFVFNVEKDLTSQGGAATDILKKVPQVSVDADGNVELLGSGNVRVFINGKPSTMFDNNLAEALQAIPASQIKSIEVITSPGAQYDAQGTGGIINIILKDNRSQGVNGSISLSGGTRLENGSANIHARKGKVDVSASLSGNAQLKGATLNSLDRTTDSGRLVQNGQGTLEKNGYRGQLGAGWAISKKDDITAAVSYNNFGNSNEAFVNQDAVAFYPAGTVSTVRNSGNTFRYRTTDWNINYARKFDKDGQELDVSYQSSYGHGTTYYEENQRYANNDTLFAGARGNNKLKDLESYVIADYAQPLSKDIVLNTGLKGSFSRINSYSGHYLLNPGSQQYLFDPSQLDNFTFSRDIYAVYVSVTFPLGKNYTVKSGIRDEYTDINIPSDSGRIAPSYNSFIPTIVISRKLGSNQTLKASFYRRIQRAGYRELNPFIDATDPTSLAQGNPYLKPERMNAGELSYYRFFDKGSSILVTLYYKYTLDDEQSYILHADSLAAGKTVYRDVTITTNENAGTQQLTGLNISGTLSLSQKLELRGNAILFNKYIVSTLVPGTTFISYNYRINGNAAYQFSKALVAEFFGSFNSPRTEVQGKFPSFTSYSFAIRQLLFKKKASIAFTTTNPFNKYTSQLTSITGQNFTVNSNRRIPYQSFGLNFTYKFGKMEYKEKKQDKDMNGQDEGN